MIFISYETKSAPTDSNSVTLSCPTGFSLTEHSCVAPREYFCFEHGFTLEKETNSCVGRRFFTTYRAPRNIQDGCTGLPLGQVPVLATDNRPFCRTYCPDNYDLFYTESGDNRRENERGFCSLRDGSQPPSYPAGFSEQQLPLPSCPEKFTHSVEVDLERG
eukprot:Pgem_evm1s8645